MVNVAWVVLHRKSPHWNQGTETADTTCALSGSISGAGKSIEIRLRMRGPLLLLLTQRVKPARWNCIISMYTSDPVRLDTAAEFSMKRKHSVQRLIALARSFIMPVSQLHIDKFD